MKYLIWSLEHEGWWAPNEMGYVKTPDLAGLYDKEAAEKICTKANQYLPAGFVNEVCIPARNLAPEPRKTYLNTMVPFDFKGSPVEQFCKRAGRIIECAFHVFTFRQKSTGQWKNLIIFEDQDKQEFCYAFDLDEYASLVMAQLLIKGHDTIKEQEQPGALA